MQTTYVQRLMQPYTSHINRFTVTLNISLPPFQRPSAEPELLRSPGSDSKESNPPGYVTLQARARILNFEEAQESIPRNQFRQTVQPRVPVRQAYSNSVPVPIDCIKFPAQYDIPIPTRFLAPIACLKIPALINRCDFLGRLQHSHWQLLSSMTLISTYVIQMHFSTKRETRHCAKLNLKHRILW